ncbi:MAG: ATP-binding cassette domain-containing protein [Bacteroidaceae bacterium]|jgi:cell division transport system ATP-binding protein|nr:ATP-binding cassette domain-containing protein [Bacteroidaceae bacterium]
MILSYKNINVFQGEHQVLKNVNITVEEGEMVYLVGQVGSGKSSLLKTFYAEVPCQGEEANVLGYNMLKFKTKQQPALRREMGIVFQDFQLLTDRTVFENLNFVLKATGWKKKAEREERILDVLKQVRMEEKADNFIFELSGGEQQRVCIARALLNNPKVILADEPTGNLDAENGEMILALLDEIRRQKHTAIIMSTHNWQWIDYFPGTVYKCQNNELIK